MTSTRTASVTLLLILPLLLPIIFAVALQLAPTAATARLSHHVHDTISAATTAAAFIQTATTARTSITPTTTSPTTKTIRSDTPTPMIQIAAATRTLSSSLLYATAAMRPPVSSSLAPMRALRRTAPSFSLDAREIHHSYLMLQPAAGLGVRTARGRTSRDLVNLMGSAEGHTTSVESPIKTKDSSQVKDSSVKAKGGNNPEVKQTVSATAHLDSVFAVYKPKGWTSAGVVAKIKFVLRNGLRDDIRANESPPSKTANLEEQTIQAGGTSEAAEGKETNKLNKKKKQQQQHERPRTPKVKVGHGGTLDPMAAGVLVIGVGKGCRELTNFLSGSKAYRAEALLGCETDTQDAEGEETIRGPWEHVTNEDIDSALGEFTGHIMQMPPMFSALRKDGKRLYELARQGKTVEREARPVMVYSLKQTDPRPALPRVGLDIECGGGFYVRTLIHDLGRTLGSRGHMTALERTKQGPFELRDTLPLEDWNFDGLVEHIAKARKMMPVPPLGNSTAIKEDAVELPPVGNLVTATVE